MTSFMECFMNYELSTFPLITLSYCFIIVNALSMCVCGAVLVKWLLHNDYQMAINEVMTSNKWGCSHYN